MDSTNDLVQVVLTVLGIDVGMVALLFLLAAIDPQTDKRRVAQPRAVPPRSNL